ncbi:MAG: hypothetical protein ACREFH_16900 [Stellaceae bacterium]
MDPRLRREARQSMGADAPAADTRERLRVGSGKTTADGRITLGPDRVGRGHCGGARASAAAA